MGYGWWYLEIPCFEFAVEGRLYAYDGDLLLLGCHALTNQALDLAHRGYRFKLLLVGVLLTLGLRIEPSLVLLSEQQNEDNLEVMVRQLDDPDEKISTVERQKAQTRIQRLQDQHM
jgi:hypothetical protein